MSERWERKKRIGASRVSRSRDPRCDGVIGYELTGAKGPSRTPLRRGSRRRKLVEGEKSFYYEERRAETARFHAHGTNNSVDTPRPPLARCLFCACTHALCYSLSSLARLRSVVLAAFLFRLAQHVDDERSRDTTLCLSSYLRQTVPNHATLCLSLFLSSFLHLFHIASST